MPVRYRHMDLCEELDLEWGGGRLLMKKNWILLMLALILAIPASAEEFRDAQEIIEEMVVDYGAYGEEALPRVDALCPKAALDVN